MNKIVLLLYIMSSSLVIFPQDNTLLSVTIDSWLNNEISNVEFIQIIDNITTESSHTRALIELYAGLAYFYEEDKDNSLNRLFRSQDITKGELKQGEGSDLWRIHSEAGSYIMLQKGLSYIIKNSGKVNDYALKALEIDPNNYRAKLIVAQGYLNAPKLFGGDKKKGHKMLTEILESLDLSNKDRFFTLLTLADSTKKRDLASKYLELALKIYPNNTQSIKRISLLNE